MISTVSLDDLDRMLLRRLQADVRVSHQDLAKGVGTSAATVRRRIERLVQRDVIKLAAVPNWGRIDLRLAAFIAVWLVVQGWSSSDAESTDERKMR